MLAQCRILAIGTGCRGGTLQDFKPASEYAQPKSSVLILLYILKSSTHSGKKIITIIRDHFFIILTYSGVNIVEWNRSPSFVNYGEKSDFILLFV